MSDHYGVYLNFKKKIDDILFSLIDRKYPATLYEPIRYLLSSGGKRIRPMMVMFACEATGEDPEKSVNAAVAMELLHNFTLVHDDIMDNANTRRGFQTIHKKWNENVAILTGDLLIGLAYKYLFKTETLRLKETADEFTGGIIEVCEGQSFDKEFEERDNVTLDEYMMMIKKKTAKMLEISAAIGALTGNADKDLLNNLKKFALNTGLAFQIQDDLLDITADESELGKKIGGDILERKKTFLLIKATETVSGADRNLIMDIINRPDLNISDEIILQVKDIYIKQGITEAARSEIEIFTNKADDYLSNIKNNSSVDRLKWFSAMLMERKF